MAVYEKREKLFVSGRRSAPQNRHQGKKKYTKTKQSTLRKSNDKNIPHACVGTRDKDGKEQKRCNSPKTTPPPPKKKRNKFGTRRIECRTIECLTVCHRWSRSGQKDTMGCSSEQHSTQAGFSSSLVFGALCGPGGCSMNTVEMASEGRV